MSKNKIKLPPNIKAMAEEIVRLDAESRRLDKLASEAGDTETRHGFQERGIVVTIRQNGIYDDLYGVCDDAGIERQRVLAYMAELKQKQDIQR
jgi:hypothetical protein